jgi:hypothetical protein
MDVDGDFDIVAKALVEDMWLTIADSHRKKRVIVANIWVNAF